MTRVLAAARLAPLLLTCASGLGAGTGALAAGADDPPGRVVQIGLLDGTAAVEPAGAEEWESAVVNLPLTSGDKVWVDAESRAELHLGSVAIRLADRTAVHFLAVADAAMQFEVTAGTVNVRLRYLSPDETFEIDTPNVAVALVEPGEYRIDVDDSGDVTEVGVLSGQAEVSSPSQVFTLRYRQQGHFAGTGSVMPGFDDLSAPDVFDQWAAARDDREDRTLAANYVSRDETGYEDLDGYGTWQTEADIGPVWVPQVDPGWAPYQNGFWVWMAPWGWTWVDAAPWGFAPSHYGRWVHLNRGWAWSPGAIAVRPTYAPAVVAWVGGTAGVAWCALGYDEIYRPPYRASARYLRNVNVTNTFLGNTTLFDTLHASAAEHYVNQRVRGAVIVVTRDVFAAGRPVNQHLEHVDASALAGAAAGTALLTIDPNRRSFVRERTGAAVRPPPPDVFNRSVVARTPLAAGMLSARLVRPAMIRSIPLLSTQKDSPANSPANARADSPATHSPPPAPRPAAPREENREAAERMPAPRPAAAPRPAPAARPMPAPAAYPSPEHAPDRPPAGEAPPVHRPDPSPPVQADREPRPKRPEPVEERRGKPQLRQSLQHQP